MALGRTPPVMPRPPVRANRRLPRRSRWVVQQSRPRVAARRPARHSRRPGPAAAVDDAAGRAGARPAARGRPVSTPLASGRKGAAPILAPCPADRRPSTPRPGSQAGRSGRPSPRRHSTCVPAASLGLVHGDCKPSQFLLDRAARSTCSTSTTAESPTRPAMRAPSSRRCASSRCGGPSPGDHRRLRPVCRTGRGIHFATVYSKSHGRSCSSAGSRWHEVVALQRKALRSFARSPKSPLPAALVEEGHRCLDRA